MQNAVGVGGKSLSHSSTETSHRSHHRLVQTVTFALFIPSSFAISVSPFPYSFTINIILHTQAVSDICALLH